MGRPAELDARAGARFEATGAFIEVVDPRMSVCIPNGAAGTVTSVGCGSPMLGLTALLCP